jgi:hypothetical protein
MSESSSTTQTRESAFDEVDIDTVGQLSDCGSGETASKTVPLKAMDTLAVERAAQFLRQTLLEILPWLTLT